MSVVKLMTTGDHDETQEGVISGVSRDTPTTDGRRRRRLSPDPMVALRGGPHTNLTVERGVDHDTARTMPYPLMQRPVLAEAVEANFTSVCNIPVYLTNFAFTLHNFILHFCLFIYTTFYFMFIMLL